MSMKAWMMFAMAASALNDSFSGREVREGDNSAKRELPKWYKKPLDERWNMFMIDLEYNNATRSGLQQYKINLNEMEITINAGSKKSADKTLIHLLKSNGIETQPQP